MKDEIIGVVPVVVLSSDIILGTHERIASGSVGETEVYQVFHNYYQVFVRFPNQNDETCLWLKNLPRLNGLHEVAIEPSRYHPKPEKSRIGSDGQDEKQILYVKND